MFLNESLKQVGEATLVFSQVVSTMNTSMGNLIYSHPTLPFIIHSFKLFYNLLGYCFYAVLTNLKILAI